jgi:hypothetical protein
MASCPFLDFEPLEDIYSTPDEFSVKIKSRETLFVMFMDENNSYGC